MLEDDRIYCVHSSEGTFEMNGYEITGSQPDDWDEEDPLMVTDGDMGETVGWIDPATGEFNPVE